MDSKNIPVPVEVITIVDSLRTPGESRANAFRRHFGLPVYERPKAVPVPRAIRPGRVMRYPALETLEIDQTVILPWEYSQEARVAGAREKGWRVVERYAETTGKKLHYKPTPGGLEVRRIG